MTSQSKKPKMEGNDGDFDVVKKYLLECPHLAQENPAIRAALEGLERERTRRERDAKLQAKFAKSTTAKTNPRSPEKLNTSLSSSLADSDVVVVDESLERSAVDDPDEMMEWQDVENNKKEEEEDDEDGTSFLGKQLVKLAIDAIAEHNVRIRSPVAAVAVVLHAAMRSELLGFSCTGIPEDGNASNGGFAPPIRELPKGQFLPNHWDAPNDSVSLRYRKKGTGAIVLTVKRDAENVVSVQLIPNEEPPSESLSFPLQEHINLDSFTTALKTATAVPPALHYKGLQQLLTKFCRTFDLGSINDVPTTAAPYVDTTVIFSKGGNNGGIAEIRKSDFVPPIPPDGIPNPANRPEPWETGVPATIDQAFGRNMPGDRDFEDDLAPGGLRDPLCIGRGRMGGNLMGPNHPMFGGVGGMGGPQFGGPGTMQPRFDPFFPPGVDPQKQPHPGRTRHPGEPNPDHLPPPNAFGHDMFS